MRRLVAVVAVLAALPLAGCGGGGDADRYVLDVHGVAQVGAETLATGKHKLAVGQTVTIERGSAVLGLPGDTSLELRRASRVTVDPRPVLVEGDALAVAGDDDLRLRAGGADVEVHDGAARFRRMLGVTVAVYEGTATVRSLGRRLATPALRQVTVSDSGVLPRRPVPLVYDRLDPDRWDTRYLNDAIDLGGQLERGVRLLNARPAPARLDLPYLREVVPAIRSAKGLDAAVVRSTRSVGETIVGASIALGGDGDLVSRWDRAFDFRDEGADWGLVALDQRARRSTVLGVMNGVLDRVIAKISPVATGGGGQRSSTGAAGRSTTTTTTSPRRAGTTPAAPAAPTTPTLPPITVPILPSSPTPTTPPPTTPTRPSSPPTIPSTPKPTIPPVTVPPPVKGLVDGLLDGLLGSRDNNGNGNGGSGSDGNGSSGNGKGNGQSLLGDLLDGLLGGR